MNKFEIVWTAPEYEHRPKSPGWYWTSILVAVIILGIAVWQQNYIFAVFVIMAEMLIIVWGNREPRMIDFKINERGLYVGSSFYPYAHITSFSYTDHDHTEWADVIFYFEKRLQGEVKFHFPKNRLNELQGDLLNMAPLVVHEESLLDTFERFFGF